MLKLVLSVVVLLLVLSFFGISLQHVVESPAAQANFAYIGDLLKDAGTDAISYVTGLWNNIF